MTAGKTYVQISTTTLGSAAASHTFTSIPATYTDLVCVVNKLTAPAAVSSYMQVGNGSVDTGTNYSYTCLYGYGTAASTGNQGTSSIKGLTQANIMIGGIQHGLSTTVPTTIIIHLINYANTGAYKAFISRDTDRSGTGSTSFVVGSWRSNSAIDTLKIYSSSTYASGATFTLYGIAAA